MSVMSARRFIRSPRRRRLELERCFEKRLDRRFGRLRSLSVVAYMRIELDARILVGKGLARRGVDQQARGLFAYHAMAHGLAVGGDSRRHRTEWIVESVRGIRILGQLNVPSGRLEPLHIGLAERNRIVVVLRAS